MRRERNKKNDFEIPSKEIEKYNQINVIKRYIFKLENVRGCFVFTMNNNLPQRVFTKFKYANKNCCVNHNVLYKYHFYFLHYIYIILI